MMGVMEVANSSKPIVATIALLRRARLRNRERCAGPLWRPSERWRSGWDGEFESPSLQRRVSNEPCGCQVAMARYLALKSYKCRAAPRSARDRRRSLRCEALIGGLVSRKVGSGHFLDRQPVG